ncbi:MAG TPA: hypothetical protein GXX18_09450 [Bacillales bacterium]|nr:hypothetical protein [Bacillales bacterium]
MFKFLLDFRKIILKELFKNFLIMTVILLLGISVYYFFFRIDESALEGVEGKITSDSEINSYFNGAYFLRDTENKPVKSKTLTSYGYILSLDGNEKFSNMDDEEKLIVIGLVSERLAVYTNNATMLNCGRNKVCTIRKISFFGVGDEIDTYSVAYKPTFNAHDYTMRVLKTNSAGYFEDYDVTLDDKNIENEDVSTVSIDIKSQGVKIGMTKEEVLNSSWGKPQDINRTTTQFGTSEQWVYPGYRFIYFDDDIVTAIQD